MRLKPFTHQGWRWIVLLQEGRERPGDSPLELVFVGEEIGGDEVARYGLPLATDSIDELTASLGDSDAGILEDLLYRAWEEGRKLEESRTATSP